MINVFMVQKIKKDFTTEETIFVDFKKAKEEFCKVADQTFLNWSSLSKEDQLDILCDGYYETQECCLYLKDLEVNGDKNA